jgi:hypothetical protein
MMQRYETLLPDCTARKKGTIVSFYIDHFYYRTESTQVICAELARQRKQTKRGNQIKENNNNDGNNNSNNNNNTGTDHAHRNVSLTIISQ